jgi:hypothetical protein
MEYSFQKHSLNFPHTNLFFGKINKIRNKIKKEVKFVGIMEGKGVCFVCQ